MRVLILLVLFSGSLSAQFTEGMIDLGRDSMFYLANFPEGYEAREDWPLVLFLHGGGESGRDLEKVKSLGMPERIVKGERFPFVTLAPQNKFGRGFWDLTALRHLLDEFTAKHNIDHDRIYLTGYSRGGLGAWMLAMANPGYFAALAPVAGAVPTSYDVWVPPGLPIWIHHGTDDDLIHPSESIRMLEILRQKQHKPTPKLTMYEGVGHDSWRQAYASSDLYEWLLAQRRPAKPE